MCCLSLLKYCYCLLLDVLLGKCRKNAVFIVGDLKLSVFFVFFCLSLSQKSGYVIGMEQVIWCFCVEGVISSRVICLNGESKGESEKTRHLKMGK